MEQMTYTLAEIRDGTGWPKGARFALVQAAAQPECNASALAAAVADLLPYAQSRAEDMEAEILHVSQPMKRTEAHAAWLKADAAVTAARRLIGE